MINYINTRYFHWVNINPLKFISICTRTDLHIRDYHEIKDKKIEESKFIIRV